MSSTPSRLVALCAAGLIGLSACASTAPYGPATGPDSQGWSQQAIETNRWRVRYRGTGSPTTVADRALLRAAELTLEQGGSWFVVTDRWIEAGDEGGVRPSVSIGAGSTDYGRYSSSGVGVGLGLNLGGGSPTVAVLEIRIGSGPQPAGPDVYRAAEVETNLWSRVR